MKLIIDIPDEYYDAIRQISEETSTADMLIIKNGKPLDDELQEIRQKISDIQTEGFKDAHTMFIRTNDQVKNIALEIIDSHISALNNDQFERIWQNTVEEMKRRKINEI